MASEIQNFRDFHYPLRTLQQLHILIFSDSVMATVDLVENQMLRKIRAGSVTRFAVDLLPDVAKEHNVTVDQVMIDNLPLILSEPRNYAIFYSENSRSGLALPFLQHITAVHPGTHEGVTFHGGIYVIPEKMKFEIDAIKDSFGKLRIFRH